MGTRLILLLCMILWPCLGHCQKENELQFVYKGIYYKKAKVMGVTEAGVTLNTDRGRVTVPIDILPFRMQEDLKKKLASQQAPRQPRSPSDSASSPRSDVSEYPPLSSETPTEEEAGAPKKSVPLNLRLVRDVVLGAGLGIVGLLFLLGGFLSSTKKLLSLTVAVLCLGGAYFPARNAIETFLVHQKWTVESAEREAVRQYPELAIPGSKMHSTYLSLHAKYQADAPEFFDKPDWPLRLALEASEVQ